MMYCGNVLKRLLPGCRPLLIKLTASPGYITGDFWGAAVSSFQPFLFLSLQTGSFTFKLGVNHPVVEAGRDL